MLEVKLNDLREINGMVQRQITAEIEDDTVYTSKLEIKGKILIRKQISKPSKLFNLVSDKFMNVLNEDKIIICDYTNIEQNKK